MSSGGTIIRGPTLLLRPPTAISRWRGIQSDRREANAIGGRLNALEGVQLHGKRALTKFQVNLVIPKAIFMVISQPKGGDMYLWGFLSYF